MLHSFHPEKLKKTAFGGQEDSGRAYDGGHIPPQPGPAVSLNEDVSRAWSIRIVKTNNHANWPAERTSVRRNVVEVAGFNSPDAIRY